MKKVHDLYYKLKDEEYVIHQFVRDDLQFEDENSSNRRILFVNVQHNGRNYYRYIQPYMDILLSGLGKVAMNKAIDQYRVNKEYTESNWELDDDQIYWATTIVFPFTPKPLIETYRKIRFLNPNCKIIFYIDFNFYRLPKDHILTSLFKLEDIKNIEDNIFFSDQVNSMNMDLISEISGVFIEKKTKTIYADYDEEEFKSKFVWHPIMVSQDIAYENINDIQASKKTTDNDEVFKIGIVGTNYHFNDIKNYAKTLMAVQKKIGVDKLKFYLIGFDGFDLFNAKYKCFDNEFVFESIKPSTMVHWHKMLIDLNLDLFFIPLKKTIFNKSAENLNKFLEFTAVNVPILAPEFEPYTNLKDYSDMMFTYADSTDLKGKLIDIVTNVDSDVLEQKTAKSQEYLQKYHLITPLSMVKLKKIIENVF